MFVAMAAVAVVVMAVVPVADVVDLLSQEEGTSHMSLQWDSNPGPPAY